MNSFYRNGSTAALTKLALMPSQLQHTLVGAGIGGVLGAGVGAFSGTPENRQRNMVRGGLGGAVLGGAAGFSARPTFGDHVMSQPRQLMDANPVTHAPVIQPQKEFIGGTAPRSLGHQARVMFNRPATNNAADVANKLRQFQDQQSLHIPTPSDSMSYNAHGV